jgi:PAS domain S-box-containing protein
MPSPAEERIAEFAELVAQALANREAQHLLRAERDFAATLVEITQALVCVFDRDGRILQFNSACEAATGFSADEVVGRSACDFVIPADEREAFNAMLEHVWETGEPFPVRAQWLTRDGGRRDIEWSNRALLDESGSVTSFVTTGLDVTERVRATREIVRLAEEQAALRRVATLVASSPAPEEVFQAVAEEAGKLIGAKSAATVRFVDEHGVTVGRWSDGEPRTSFAVGTVVPLTESEGVTARVWRTGALARVHDYDGLRGEAARLMREAGYRTAVAAPISVGGRTWGALLVASEDPLGPDAEQRLGDFTDLVALALQSAEAQEQLTASRARLVEASVAERRRLERNLHDGAQQRLVSLSLLLRLAQARLRDNPAGAEEMLATGSLDLQLALEELRELARGLHPAVLTDRGLGPALESLAARAPFPVEIGKVPPARLGEAVEAAIYYVVAESLTNAAKHSAASGAWVLLRVDGETAVAEIRDDGCGGADAARGSGLRGLADRVEALGGRFELESPESGGTVVRACLPLA